MTAGVETTERLLAGDDAPMYRLAALESVRSMVEKVHRAGKMVECGHEMPESVAREYRALDNDFVAGMLFNVREMTEVVCDEEVGGDRFVAMPLPVPFVIPGVESVGDATRAVVTARADAGDVVFGRTGGGSLVLAGVFAVSDASSLNSGFEPHGGDPLEAMTGHYRATILHVDYTRTEWWADSDGQVAHMVSTGELPVPYYDAEDPGDGSADGELLSEMLALMAAARSDECDLGMV